MSDLITHAQNGTLPCDGKCSCLPLGVLHSCLENFSRAVHTNTGTVVLIGTGSGINYLLDAMQYNFSGHKQLVIIYSTRDNNLFNWARWMVDKLVTNGDTHLKILMSNTDAAVRIRSAHTNGKVESTYRKQNNHPEIVRYTVGRIDFETEIPLGSQVFFQGSWQVRKAVSAACKRNKCTGYYGRGTTNIYKNPLRIVADKATVIANRVTTSVTQIGKYIYSSRGSLNFESTIPELPQLEMGTPIMEESPGGGYNSEKKTVRVDHDSEKKTVIVDHKSEMVLDESGDSDFVSDNSEGDDEPVGFMLQRVGTSTVFR
eukprot:sb/3466993/